MSACGQNRRWAASARIERQKLANKEDDWSLNGKVTVTPPTRTRNGGTGRPNLIKWSWDKSSESEDSEWTSPSIESKESDELYVLEVTKPPATRVILEVQSLKSMMEQNCRCKRCYKSVDVYFRAVSLATSIMITCKHPRCGFIYYSDPPAQVTIERASDNRDRSTDYAINSL
jgi:hypothetical protein